MLKADEFALCINLTKIIPANKYNLPAGYKMISYI